MQEATEAFVKAADWLTEADQAALTALQQMAAALDEPKKFTSSLMAQWYRVYHDLRSKQPAAGPVEKDEQEVFMTELGI